MREQNDDIGNILRGSLSLLPHATMPGHSPTQETCSRLNSCLILRCGGTNCTQNFLTNESWVAVRRSTGEEESGGGERRRREEREGETHELQRRNTNFSAVRTSPLQVVAMASSPLAAASWPTVFYYYGALGYLYIGGALLLLPVAPFGPLAAAAKANAALAAAARGDHRGEQHGHCWCLAF